MVHTEMNIQGISKGRNSWWGTGVKGGGTNQNDSITLIMEDKLTSCMVQDRNLQNIEV